MAIDIVLWDAERHAEFTAPIRIAFGGQFDPERSARMQRLSEITQRIAALDGSSLVGSAGSFQLTMTTPGGSVPIAGLTMVAVLPTHRRRGILTSMIRRHFEEARAAGQPVSALWASEGSIYGRFGYGMATLQGSITLERDRAIFRKSVPREGKFRLLDTEAALAALPPIYDRVRAVTPGVLSRSPLWWEYRRLGDYDKSLPPLQCVLLELDGRAEGYAVYRFPQKIQLDPVVVVDLGVIEAVATSPRATALLWRYLCDIDLVKHIEAALLPPSHPILHLVTEPRRLSYRIGDALWVRLIDVEAALARRSWQSPDAVTFELSDEFCPWNAGVYRAGEGRALRSAAAPELRMDASALGALYLGGITAFELAEAGHIEELAPGAVVRADAIFRSPRAPWCPEIF
jgi:predicted acetyltransferase